VTNVLLVVEQLRRRVPGGIGTYSLGLVLGLDRLEAAGEPTPALTAHASRPSRRPDPVALLGRPLRTSRLPGLLLTRAWDAGVVDVPRGFDVVHAASLATPPTRHAALAVTVHDLAWRRTSEAYPRRGLRWHETALRRVVRRADAIVVPSQAVGDEVLAAGVSAATLRVVPHGSDHLPEPDDAGAAALLQRLGVAGAYLLSVGTLEPRKNLDRVGLAYRSARLALPGPWPLVVVGPAGWGRAAAPTWASQPGVVVAGPVSGGVLAALYRRARLLVYVPLLEGFGLPPLEAMAAGTPVVASPMPSTGGEALEVEPGDVDAIADALVRVATDDGLRARLVERGRSRADALTWMASARAHVELWESLG
jgi:glycosyltransferase involved in cell wall biosynthesis